MCQQSKTTCLTSRWVFQSKRDKECASTFTSWRPNKIVWSKRPYVRWAAHYLGGTVASAESRTGGSRDWSSSHLCVRHWKRGKTAQHLWGLLPWRVLLGLGWYSWCHGRFRDVLGWPTRGCTWILPYILRTLYQLLECSHLHYVLVRNMAKE